MKHAKTLQKANFFFQRTYVNMSEKPPEKKE